MGYSFGDDLHCKFQTMIINYMSINQSINKSAINTSMNYTSLILLSFFYGSYSVLLNSSSVRTVNDIDKGKGLW